MDQIPPTEKVETPREVFGRDNDGLDTNSVRIVSCTTNNYYQNSNLAHISINLNNFKYSKL